MPDLTPISFALFPQATPAAVASGALPALEICRGERARGRFTGQPRLSLYSHGNTSFYPKNENEKHVPKPDVFPAHPRLRIVRQAGRPSRGLRGRDARCGLGNDRAVRIRKAAALAGLRGCRARRRRPIPAPAARCPSPRPAAGGWATRRRIPELLCCSRIIAKIYHHAELA